MATCVICGTTFNPVRAGHKICSDKCRHQARGYSYRQARQQALYRDGYQCTQCAATGCLECHHKVMLSAGGDNSLANLTILCQTCHRQVHRVMRGLSTRKEGNAYGVIRGGGKRHDRAA